MVAPKKRKLRKYPMLKLSEKKPLDTQLIKCGHKEGYTSPWNIKASVKKGRDSLYKGSRKVYEIEGKVKPLRRRRTR